MQKIGLCCLILFLMMLIAWQALESKPNEKEFAFKTVISKLENHEIGSIEIFYVDPNTLIMTQMTPEMLVSQFDLKITVAAVEAFSSSQGGLEALKSTTVAKSNEAAEVRFGLVFYDRKNAKVLEAFFDKNGNNGYLDSQHVSFHGRLFNWMKSKFLNNL